MNDIFVVPLTNSDKICIIDVNDVSRVMQYEWFMDSKGYAISTAELIYSRKMPNFILVRKRMIDHKNGHRADNRKSNLRPTDYSANNHNVTKDKTKTSSKYTGVHFDKSRQLWRAQIRTQRGREFIGRFNLEKEAAMAYNKAAVKYYGIHARLNEVS